MAAPATRIALSRHPREWEDFAYVYPVVSRRSHGLSIGVNLQPHGACNFDCIYCCVDRTRAVRPDRVDLDRLRRELDQMLTLAATGAIWRDPRFHDVDPGYQHLHDLAFSGNGEPTVSPAFPEAVDLAIEARARAGFATEGPRAKLVLITNATRLDRPRVAAALDRLDAAGGFEPWVKLDAGTEAYYRRINRSRVPFARLLECIHAFARRRTLVVQTMLCRLEGRAMPPLEFDAYLDRLSELEAAGRRVTDVHLYTVARRPASPTVSACSERELESFARRLRDRLPALGVRTFPAPG